MDYGTTINGETYKRNIEKYAYTKAESKSVTAGGGGGEKKKNQPPPIKNEADNGLRNTRGTIAMARTADKDSATSQFFINVADNAFLDHGQRDFGYAVFGKVVKGMDVADKISQVPTHDVGPYQNVPSKPVVILSAKVLP